MLTQSYLLITGQFRDVSPGYPIFLIEFSVWSSVQFHIVKREVGRVNEVKYWKGFACRKIWKIWKEKGRLLNIVSSSKNSSHKLNQVYLQINVSLVNPGIASNQKERVQEEGTFYFNLTPFANLSRPKYQDHLTRSNDLQWRMRNSWVGIRPQHAAPFSLLANWLPFGRAVRLHRCFKHSNTLLTPKYNSHVFSITSRLTSR